MSLHNILSRKLADDFDKYPIFGLLLHSDRDSNGHIGRLLLETEYLEKIHKHSGARWMIYVLKLLTPGPYLPLINKEDSTPFITNIESYELEDEEPFENQLMMNWFNIKQHDRLPCLIIFTVGQYDSELLYFKESIKGNSVDETFTSLYKIIKDVSLVLQGVECKYLSNRTELFNLIQNKLKENYEIELFKKLLKFGSPKDIIKLIGKLIGV